MDGAIGLSINQCTLREGGGTLISPEKNTHQPSPILTMSVMKLGVGWVGWWLGADWEWE